MCGANPAPPPVFSCASGVGLALGLRWRMLTATCVTSGGCATPGIACDSVGPGYSDGFALPLWEILGDLALFRLWFPALILDHLPKWF